MSKIENDYSRPKCADGPGCIHFDIMPTKEPCRECLSTPDNKNYEARVLSSNFNDKIRTGAVAGRRSGGNK